MKTALKIEKPKRRKWKDCTPENDIAYGGYLSYRHLRILAWLFLAVAQIAVILQISMKLNPESVGMLEGWQLALSFFSYLPLPIFMLANLSVILFSRDNYKALFMRYGVLAGGMYIAGNFVVMHFGFRSLMAFGAPYDFHNMSMAFGSLLADIGHTAYTFNIFIDLLLLCLLFFFTNYEPKSKFFQGRKIFLFRLLSLLPIIYEIAAIFIKFRLSNHSIEIPSYVFFLLPSKPPFIFLAFAIVAYAIRIAEWRYLRRPGKTKEDLLAYKQTRAHSLKVSIMISIVFLVCAVLDVATFFGVLVGYAVIYAPGATDIEGVVMKGYDGLFAAGIGDSITLIFIIPLVILYSYRKTHKNPTVDLLIPVAGIALIVVIYVEGLFQTVINNTALFVQRLANWIEQITGDTPPNEGGEAAAEVASKIPALLSGIRLI